MGRASRVWRLAVSAAATAVEATAAHFGMTGKTAVLVSTTIAIPPAIAATIDEAATPDVVGRVEAPAKWVPEQPVPGQPGVSVEIRVPRPARGKAGISGILARQFQVCLAQILGAQAAPTIQPIPIRGALLVETGRLAKLLTHHQLMAALYDDCLLMGWLIAVVHAGSTKYRSLTVEDAHRVV